MNLRLQSITKEQQELFFAFYQFYLYDLSEFTGEDLADNGMFDTAPMDLYLKRGELYPFFIQLDGRIVGFILVCSPPFVPENVDFSIQELFILKKYRGRNLATASVRLVLEQFCGRIRVEQLEANRRAVGFWRRLYDRFGIKVRETKDMITIDGLEGIHGIIAQEFENGVPKKPVSGQVET